MCLIFYLSVTSLFPVQYQTNFFIPVKKLVLFSKILNDMLSCEYVHISGDVRFLNLLTVNADTNILKFL